eukprot:6197760-Pleurochrysis_carterae.AAC.2
MSVSLRLALEMSAFRLALLPFINFESSSVQGERPRLCEGAPEARAVGPSARRVWRRIGRAVVLWP